MRGNVDQAISLCPHRFRHVLLVFALMSVFSIDPALGQSAQIDSRLEGLPIHSLLEAIPDHRIEASGIIPALSHGHYLIVSDELLSDSPELYVINAQGELITRLPILTDKEVDDLESISREGDHVTVMSSVDGGKKKRRHLLRLRVEGDRAIEVGHINIYKRLKWLSKNAEHKATRKFLKQALEDRSIDVEAHQVYQGHLYLGFKTPFNAANEAVILRLDNFDGLFDGESPSAEIWRSVALTDPPSGAATRLSDMLFYGDRLLLLSVDSRKDTPSSHLWSYRYQTSQIEWLRSFQGLRLEGLSAGPNEGEIRLVSDGGGQSSSRILSVIVK